MNDSTNWKPNYPSRMVGDPTHFLVAGVWYEALTGIRESGDELAFIIQHPTKVKFVEMRVFRSNIQATLHAAR